MNFIVGFLAELRCEYPYFALTGIRFTAAPIFAGSGLSFAGLEVVRGGRIFNPSSRAMARECTSGEGHRRCVSNSCLAGPWRGVLAPPQ